MKPEDKDGKSKFEFNGKYYYICPRLAERLLTLAYNIKDDWDFVILITGDRMVRVGKSVLAMTIAAFMCVTMQKMGLKTKFDEGDIYFDNKRMIDAAQRKPKFAINLYDEGREGLAASKAMKTFQQDLIDFFTECGQLNQLFIIVAPDFFELKEDIAVGRSEYLINVFRKEVGRELDLFRDGVKRKVIKFERGYYEMFERKLKQALYDIVRTTRRKNYRIVKTPIRGKFTNQYTIDEETYRQKKRDALSRFKERHDTEKQTRAIRHNKILIGIVIKLKKEGLNQNQIVKRLEEDFEFETSRYTVAQILRENPIEGEGGVCDGEKDVIINKTLENKGFEA